MPRIFTYGTLKKGYGNHSCLKFDNSTVFEGRAETRKEFLLRDNGFYPYMQESPDGYSVKGEVYNVSDETKAILDRLEGIPHHYQCKLIKLMDDSTAYAYIIEANDDRFTNLPECEIKGEFIR